MTTIGGCLNIRRARMLRKHRLLFPNLYFYKDGKLKRNNGKTTKIRLYKLDWNSIEKIKQEHHDKWLKEQWNVNPSTRPKFLTLPPEYIDIVDNFVFAIDLDYEKEIHRNSHRADEEWHVKRSFDTNVREYCLTPAISHVEVAFYLLSDCFYDEEKQWFSRHDGYGSIAKEAMLYRFWCGQTGRGLIWNRAGLNKLKSYVERKKIITVDVGDIPNEDQDVFIKNKMKTHMNSVQIISQFLDDMKKFKEEFEKHYEHVSIDLPEVKTK